MSVASTLATASEDRSAPAQPGFFAYHGVWAPGIRLFRSLGFGAKAVLILLAILLPLLGLLGWMLAEQATTERTARMEATRQHVGIVTSLLEWTHAREVSGELSRAEAQRLVLEQLRTLRYDGGGYFWVSDFAPAVIMHPTRPDLEGRNEAGLEGGKGVALVQAFAERVRASGAGFVESPWPERRESGPGPQLSYVETFEPWGWIVGSGVHLEGLDAGLHRQLQRIAAVLAVALLVTGYLFVSFFRVMEGGLRETRRHLRAMTEGDLTTTPSPWGNDEPAQLMVELKLMQDSLRSMVNRVRSASDEIVRSSGEIAAGSSDLSDRTEQTAANLEEAAAAMEELSATVKQTADSTQEASAVAHRNADIAAEGGRAMEQVGATMAAIRESSTEIARIVGTIDSIAFQTNLLALNAAVEAARAGEQGRGFAVVAGEVQMLARRSADAAREINTLIGRSVEQVAAGASAVQDAGSTIAQIVSSSERGRQLLADIAHAAQEQANGIGQIGQAIAELDRMTQRNAAMVEQTAAASADMRGQAHTLAEEVARFRLPAVLHVTHARLSHAGVFDFDQAIDAHRQWKVKLRQAMESRQQLDVATISRDDCCALGKWIHGDGQERLGAWPDFTALRERHAHFHQVTADVAGQVNGGHYRHAESLMGQDSAFARASTDVVTLLTQAKREFH